MKERDQLEDERVEGMTTLKYIFKGIGCEGVHWIDLAQDMDSWRALVGTVVSFRVPLDVGNFLAS